MSKLLAEYVALSMILEKLFFSSVGEARLWITMQLLLTDAEKRSIKTHVTTYDNYNPDTGETAYDGPTILFIIFQTMLPNGRVDVFNKIGSMKDVTLEICNNKFVECISKMTMKRINIELKIPGAYDDDQFLVKIYAGALLEKCKTFTN